MKAALGNGSVMATRMMSCDSQLAAFKSAIADRYLIVAELGRGGMSRVYRARDVRLGRSVALKVLAPDGASPAAVTAFQREGSHMLRLEHPNILPILDVGEALGLPFYVMRHVKGGSLRLRLEREGRLGLAQAVRIACQTAAALTYAHESRVLHCDVKPENMLLEGDHVYLADFGISLLARPADFGWGSGAVMRGAGTTTYVSPEQALGEPGIDRRTDVYSLACVVYEMLAGKPPFKSENERDFLARRLACPVVEAGAFPRTVPAALLSELERALAWSPDLRHPSAADFAARLVAGSLEERRLGGRRPAHRLSQSVRRILAILAAVRL